MQNELEALRKEVAYLKSGEYLKGLTVKLCCTNTARTYTGVIEHIVKDGDGKTTTLIGSEISYK